MEQKIRNLLANNIIYYRHQNNWSQEAFAEKLNSSPAYISQLENAKRNVRIDFLDRIAVTFNIQIYELFMERDIIHNKRITK